MTDGDSPSDGAADGTPPEGPPEHIPKQQLHALVWAIKRDPPPADGEEGADSEINRMLRTLDDAYDRVLPQEFRLGPETVTRYLEHQRGCEDCRMMLLEDAPDARPPKTETEKQAEVQSEIDKRKQLVMKFWRDISFGVVGFGGAQFCYIKFQQKRFAQQDEGGPSLEAKQGFQIDPLMMGFMSLLLFAAWFLAEAWVDARTLGWFDMTNWKRAVPVIGKKWAEKSTQAKLEQTKKKD
jgi:hypothetical protein